MRCGETRCSLEPIGKAKTPCAEEVEANAIFLKTLLFRGAVLDRPSLVGSILGARAGGSVHFGTGRIRDVMEVTVRWVPSGLGFAHKVTLHTG